jgi:GNAT acetyltransferase-like protein
VVRAIRGVAVVEIVELTTEREAAWDAFVAGCEGGLLYYSMKYRRFLTELLGCRPIYWVAVRGEEVVGVLPIMSREGPYGTVWNSLPFYGSHGGVLATDPGAAEALYRQYNGMVATEGIAAATLVGNPFQAPDESLLEFDVVDQRVGQFLSLRELDTDDPERFLARADGSARRNVRKAIASGITVRIDNEALAFLEACHRANMAAIGGRAKSPRFFELVPRHFVSGHDYDIYVAEVAGRPIAALLLFYCNGTVEYFIPAVEHAHRSDQPMAVIVCQAMRDVLRRGCRRWNWGGTWGEQTGVYRFKKKWGSSEVLYRYYTRVRNPTLLEAAREELLEGYENFFVLPFGMLRTIGSPSPHFAPARTTPS